MRNVQGLRACSWSKACWGGLLALVLAAPATAGNVIFKASFDEFPEGPFSEGDASRFLTQATFGPTLAEIDRVQRIGYSAWINEQIALPPEYHLPFLDERDAAGDDVYQNHRQESWFTRAVRSNDQLRQRVAFALSQILVVSDRSSAADHPFGMAHYYDALVRNAFGNYRTLLNDVTLHPVMGNYLSSLRNRKEDTALNIRPDENYAREVMQLFSIGLHQLNADGTRRLDPQGQPIPTYDQDDIVGLAGLSVDPRAKRRHKGFVFTVYVAPAHRRQGLAERLLRALIDEAGEGLAAIMLTVNAESDAARRLYEKLGFRRYGTEPRALFVDGRYYDEDLMVLLRD